MCKTFKDWMFNQFDLAELQNIADQGCQNGFSGLIYYSETTQLYQQYKSDIWELLSQDAESFGCDSLIDLIATFNGKKDVHNSDQFENLLVWYAAERIADEAINHDN